MLETSLAVAFSAGLILAWALAMFCAADFVCGFVHWFEDNYGREDWPLVGPSIITPNRLHHDQPRAFLVNSWWKSAQSQLLVGAVVLNIAVALDWFSWQLLLFVVFAVNANEVHKWAHRSRRDNPRLVTWLQGCGLLQNQRHHARHHRGARNSHYCTLGNWLNPLLDRSGFWRGLEHLVLRLAGVAPRVEGAARTIA